MFFLKAEEKLWNKKFYPEKEPKHTCGLLESSFDFVEKLLQKKPKIFAQCPKTILS